MTDAIQHRGPDDNGYYTDGPVGLGHRRLAIIDPTSAGAQPMANRTGDIVMVFNGEIYNFMELRNKLQALGYSFASKTDSEVIIYSYQEWGPGFVEQLNGMFAFALYDKRDEDHPIMFLARDRFGVKPLYYTVHNECFLFGSEIKALLKHPALSASVSYEAMSQYFAFQNIFTDATLFEHVRLLSAGCTLTIDPTQANPVRKQRYWDYRFHKQETFSSREEAAEELYRLFEQSVTRQLISDVPVGSYLSGGMDSGAITAVAARSIPRIHTFTCGFDTSSASGLEVAFDERQAAEAMANNFKTEHYQVVLHAGDMENVLPELIWHLEDLRVGQSYPNYYVSRLTSKFVKVVLSGSGGDELFAGYPWRYYRGTQATTDVEYYREYYDYWQRLIPDDDRHLFFNASTYRQVEHYPPFDAFTSVYRDSDHPMNDLEDYINASLYFEIRTFLHGLFVVEDKLSMAHGLETRVPFMDNDLVDFAMKLPPRYKLLNLKMAPVVDEDEPGKRRKYFALETTDGKTVLRDAMRRLMPQSILERKKQGFSAPDASWFRGESIDYVNELLDNRYARIYEYLNHDYVSARLREHTTGQHNNRLLIWSLLSFEWWLRHFIS